MGNLCCGGDSSTALTSKELQERDEIRRQQSEKTQQLQYNNNHAIQESVAVFSEKSQPAPAPAPTPTPSKPTNKADDSLLSSDIIEANIYPPPNFTRSDKPTRPLEKPHTRNNIQDSNRNERNKLESGNSMKFMNDPNPRQKVAISKSNNTNVNDFEEEDMMIQNNIWPPLNPNNN